MEPSLYNFYLMLLMIVLFFGGLLGCYYFFGRIGLFFFVPIAVIVANIQVLKLVEILGFTTALGNAAYSSTFLISDILSENYGKKDARISVRIGFFSLLLFSTSMYVTVLFVPHPQDFSQPHIQAMFTLVPRMVAAGFITYYIVQNFDVWLYHQIKDRRPKYLFLRNNLSTFISQAIDTLLFSSLAFGLHVDWGFIKIEPLYEWSVIGEIMVVAYLFKWMMAVLDTPFIYIARWIKKNDYFFQWKEGKLE